MQSAVQPGDKEKFPRKEVALGLLLLVLGMIFYTLAHLHHKGHTREHIKEGSVRYITIDTCLCIKSGTPANL